MNLTIELRSHTVDFLRVLADTTRMEILDLLREGEKTSSEIQEQLDKSQSTVSKHLNILDDNNLITYERRQEEGGKSQNYYQIKYSKLFKLLKMIQAFVVDLNKEKIKELRDLDVRDTLI